MVSPSKRPVESRPDHPQEGLNDDGGIRSPLRLSVTRGKLGIELYQSQRLGPLAVSHLAMTLPGLSFPVDLSGGVPTFRHRRGVLQSVELLAPLRGLVQWAGPRLSEIIGPLERPVSIRVRGARLQVGLVAEARALAFDLLWVPIAGDAQWVVSGARGVGLQGAALGYALRAVDAVFKGLATRSGRMVRIVGTSRRICKAVLPPLGARVPSCDELSFHTWELSDDELSVAMDARKAARAVEPEFVAAMEFGQLVANGDDAIAAGRADEARVTYLRALESAPRHPELSMLVAEIDLAEGGRQEAALGLLVESTLAVNAGRIGGLLLARAGDLDGAREAWAAAARSEWFAPLAALLWLELHSEAEDAGVRAEALDAAVGSCPELGRVRWARFRWRVERGDWGGAVSDAQHIEAATHGSPGKHQVCMRVAAELSEYGFHLEARVFFERALRYLPDDVRATVGLARAYRDAGEPDRALSLYERAARLDESSAAHHDEAHLEFAELLAEQARDLPQAVARVRRVGDARWPGVRARLLEARWRAQLGDLAGASLAFGRLRTTAELTEDCPVDVATWLREAALFERDIQDDLAAAERHLAVAIRIAPQNAELLELYRRTATTLVRRARSGSEPGDDSTEARSNNED